MPGEDSHAINLHKSTVNILVLVFQAHPWFKCTQWDMLYESDAAYKPTVTGDLDTQNFEKFPDVSTYYRKVYELEIGESHSNAIIYCKL